MFLCFCTPSSGSDASVLDGKYVSTHFLATSKLRVFQFFSVFSYLARLNH